MYNNTIFIAQWYRTLSFIYICVQWWWQGGNNSYYPAMNPDVLRVGIKHTLNALEHDCIYMYVYMYKLWFRLVYTEPSSRVVSDPNVCAGDNNHHLPMYTVCTSQSERQGHIYMHDCLYKEHDPPLSSYIRTMCIRVRMMWWLHTLSFVGFLCQKYVVGGLSLIISAYSLCSES